jgi:hypothetical protein
MTNIVRPSFVPVRQEGEPAAAPAQRTELKVDILNQMDKQPLVVPRAVGAIVESQSYPAAATADAGLPCVRNILIPSQDERWIFHERRSGLGLQLGLVAGALLMALGLGLYGGSNMYQLLERHDQMSGRLAIDAVVNRIISVESNGDQNAKNKRSSALGLGQFLNETWLDLIRWNRPDLANGRSESEILELRRDAKLAREMATRFSERNAAMLRQRGLPVTAGTIYLAYFAGGAGAVAILSAPANADAALVIASADTSGRITREKVIKANPFLEHFTVSDLKVWAGRKMRGTEVLEPQLKSDARKGRDLEART